MRLRHQILRFTGVGILAAIVHYGLLVLLVEFAGMPPVTAALAAFLGGGVTSYALNRRFTFASERPHSAAVPRFALVAGGGFLLTGMAMHLLTARMGVHYLAAQAATTLIVMLWTFWLNRLWTFSDGRRTR